jgi:parvulin-like peptidyl-prolyl isomerase
MKRKIIFSVIAASICGAGVFAYNMVNNDKIIATVAGNPVHESEVRKKIDLMLEVGMVEKGVNYESMTPEMKINAIKTIILGDLMEKKAKEKELDKSDKFQKLMEFEKSQVLQKILIDDVISSAVDESKLKKSYEEYVASEKGKEEVKVSQIVFASEEEVKEAEKIIKDANSFDSYVSPKDNKDGKKPEELGFFTKEQMPKEFADVAFSLDKAQVSSPIKTDFGWHIIKMLEKRKVSPLNFEQMEPKIKMQLTSQAIQSYIATMEKDNDIKVLLNAKGESK